jgi:hypothetical protein
MSAESESEREPERSKWDVFVERASEATAVAAAAVSVVGTAVVIVGYVAMAIAELRRRGKG